MANHSFWYVIQSRCVHYAVTRMIIAHRLSLKACVRSDKLFMFPISSSFILCSPLFPPLSYCITHSSPSKAIPSTNSWSFLLRVPTFITPTSSQVPSQARLKCFRCGRITNARTTRSRCVLTYCLEHVWEWRLLCWRPL